MPKTRGKTRAKRPATGGPPAVNYRMPVPLIQQLRKERRQFREALRYAEEVSAQAEDRALAEAERRHLGRVSTPKERRDAELQVKMSSALARKKLLESMVPSIWVQDYLGVTRQAVNQKVRTKKLLAVEDNGRHYFPTWQFDEEAPGKVLRGLGEVLPALGLTDYAKANWFVRKQTSLQGRTPLEMLREGQIRDVLIAARSVGAF